MKAPAWIAGGLLFLVVVQPVRSEPQRPSQESEVQSQQPLRRAVSEGAQSRREVAAPNKVGRLSPEERVKLRKDVHEANREIYQRPVPARF